MLQRGGILPFSSRLGSELLLGYERIFEDNFWTMENYEMFDFFNGYGMEGDFIKTIPGDDSESKPDKKKVFKLWLKYFFKYKYQSEKGQKKYEGL